MYDTWLLGPIGCVGGVVSFWRNEDALESVAELRVMCRVRGVCCVVEAILSLR